jgi:hypothetical protein
VSNLRDCISQMAQTRSILQIEPGRPAHRAQERAMSDGSGRTASVSSWDAVPLLPDQPGLVRRSLEASVWIDVFTPIREELLPAA